MAATEPETPSEVDIFAVGHAVVDCNFTVNADFLDARGLPPGQVALVESERQRELLNTLVSHGGERSRNCGGSAANSLYSAASFGSRCAFGGRVGDDADGHFFRAELDAAGIGHAIQPRPGTTATGSCLVMVTEDAERTMSTHLGASAQIAPEDLPEHLIAASRWVLIEGYLVTTAETFATAMRAAQLARESGAALAISLADPGIAATFSDRFAALIGHGLELILANHHEAMAYTGTTDLTRALEQLKPQGQQLALTRGGEGLLTWDGDKVQAIPAHPVEAIDESGAGDMFAGALLHGLVQGLDLATAADFGCFAAARQVQRLGARLPWQQCRDIPRDFLGLQEQKNHRQG